MFGGEGIRILVGKVSRFEFILSFFVVLFIKFRGVWREFWGGGIIIFLVLFCFLSVGFYFVFVPEYFFGSRLIRRGGGGLVMDLLL